MTCDIEPLLIALEYEDARTQMLALRVCAFATLGDKTIDENYKLLTDDDLLEIVTEVWGYFRSIDHNHATLAECDYLGLAQEIVEGNQLFEALWYDTEDCDEDAKKLGDKIKEFREEW